MELANLPRTKAVLESFRTLNLEAQENKTGDVTIKPSLRRKMKKELQQAILEDFNAAFGEELCTSIVNDDGLMMVVEHEDEGFITIEANFKFKNLDYEPLY